MTNTDTAQHWIGLFCLVAQFHSRLLNIDNMTYKTERNYSGDGAEV